MKKRPRHANTPARLEPVPVERAILTDRTIRALERLGVVESTSSGWRLTASGIRWVRHLP